MDPGVQIHQRSTFCVQNSNSLHFFAFSQKIVIINNDFAPGCDTHRFTSLHRMQQPNSLANLKQKINRTRVHIALPVTMAIFSVLAQPTQAQNKPEKEISHEYLKAEKDTIEMKRIKTYFTKRIAENKQDSSEIDKMFAHTENLPEMEKRIKKKVLKAIFESTMKNYDKCISLAIFLDPNKTTEITK